MSDYKDMRYDLLFLTNLFDKNKYIMPYKTSYLLYTLKDINSKNKSFNKYIKSLYTKYDLEHLWNNGFCKYSMDKIENVINTKEYPIFKKKFNKYLLLNKL